jgi:hypothetical protein
MPKFLLTRACSLVPFPAFISRRPRSGLPGWQAELFRQPRAFAKLIADLRQAQWVVMLGRPSAVRRRPSPILPAALIVPQVPIRRLIAIDDTKVAFTFKDCRSNGRRKVMQRGLTP